MSHPGGPGCRVEAEEIGVPPAGRPLVCRSHGGPNVRWPLALGLALLLARSQTARAEDEWLGRDKGLHAAASAAIAAGGYAASAPWIDERAGRAAIGASVALTAGAAKELWDATGRGDPSWKDFAWDVVGAAVGVGLALLVDQVASR